MPSIGPYRTIGKRISSERNLRGLSQSEAARRCRMDRAYWNKIEYGWHCPSLPVLFRVAKALGVSVPWLLRDLRDARG